MDTSIIDSKRLEGFSLVEMIVALAISTILLMGVVTIMDNNKKSYLLQNELAEIQDNARFVMDELAKEFRMAGYFGCSEKPPDNAPLARTSPSIMAIIPPSGNQDNQITDVNGNNPLTDFPLSDIIEIASFSPQLDVVSSDANNLPTALGASSIWPHPDPLNVRNQIIVSDCSGSRVYNTASPSNLNLTGGVLRFFNNPVETFLVKGAAITVAHYEVKSIKGGEGFALFKCYDVDGDNTFCNEPEDELLAEGVQNMQIRYGVGTVNTSYVLNPAGSDVKSVRVTLLMRTTKKRGIGPEREIDFQLDPNVTYNPRKDNEKLEDGYRHRLFTSTIKIRNVF
jgi:type IV pilus assembly protein PilW